MRRLHDEYDYDDDQERLPDEEPDYDEELAFDEDEFGSPLDRGSDEDDVEISMEVDAQGKEVWYADDPRVPGSSSMADSAEEAIEGIEERRRQYREQLRRSREGAVEDDEVDEIEPATFSSGEHEVEISMEVDDSGAELWFAKDPRIPGSSSMGHSAEEAVEGLEDRRRQFRDMLRKSRERRKRRKKKDSS